VAALDIGPSLEEPIVTSSAISLPPEGARLQEPIVASSAVAPSPARMCPTGLRGGPSAPAGSTWRGDGEPAKVARAVGGLARGCVERRKAALACRELGKRPAAAESWARQRTEEAGAGRRRRGPM
jgi:hypothetical protein